MHGFPRTFLHHGFLVKSKPLTTLLLANNMVRRRTMAGAVLFFAVMMSNWAIASPYGLGSEANEGCLCHSQDASTLVLLSGLPDAFEANQTYNLTLEVVSEIPQAENASKGGFRLLVTKGAIEVSNDSLVQELDGGWTHTNEGSKQRSWTFAWRSPATNDSAANFVVYGNAVNGNNAPTGDAWSSVEHLVPGVGYDGDLTPDEGIDGVSSTDRLILAVCVVLIGVLIWAVARP